MILSERLERLAPWWRAPLELVCTFIGHDFVTFPGSPTEDYCGIYCLRCGAHWNLAKDHWLLRGYRRLKRDHKM